MERKRYGAKDNDLIWESFVNKTNHKQTQLLDQLLEKDIQYIEQFLIREGLMDGVKGAFGKVKDFATQKLLKPIVDMIVGALAKDPQVGQKVAAAAEQGPDALAQLAAAEGDQSAATQVQSTPDTAAESILYQFNMNELICDALVEEKLLSAKDSQFIQEKYYLNTCCELYNEQVKNECPWRPALVTERGPAMTTATTPAAMAKQIVQLFAQARAANKNFRPGKTFDQLKGQYPAFAKYVQSAGQAAAADASAEQGGDAQTASGDDTQTPGDETQMDAETPDMVDPNAPSAETGAAPEEVPGDQAPTQAPGPDPTAIQGGQGILGKIWGFLKNNKGILTGAVALGVLGLMMTNPVTAGIALPALKTGLAGAGIGFAQGAMGTQGGVKDKLMGGLNQAGKTGAMAAGASAVAGGVGQAMDGMGGGAEAPAADAAAADAAPAEQPGGDEFVEPTRPTPDQLDQMNQDAGTNYTPPEDQAAAPMSDAEARQYHKKEFESGMTPRERMQMRPGSRGYSQAFNKYLNSAQSPI